MMLGQGIGLASSLINQSNSNYENSLDNLRNLSMKMDAEDKKGSFSAMVGILSISIVISLFLYAFTLSVFPTPLNDYLDAQARRLSEKFQKERQELSKEDKATVGRVFNVLRGMITLVLGSGIFGGIYIIYKIKTKKARQRQMQQMMEDEIKNLKEAIEEEVKSGGALQQNAKSKSDKLSGETLVELFNSFADVMSITKNLPREQEDTALEYFNKISKSIGFPESESIKASRYFEDELYGKKTTTDGDRKAFLQLLLKMLEKKRIA